MAKELAMEEKVRTIESDETYSRADVEKIQEDCQQEISAHLERFDKERAAFNEEVQDRVGDKKALEDKIKLLEERTQRSSLLESKPPQLSLAAAVGPAAAAGQRSPQSAKKVISFCFVPRWFLSEI